MESIFVAARARAQAQTHFSYHFTVSYFSVDILLTSINDSNEALLVDHLDDPVAPAGSQRTEISWKVAAGANVAYDQFPSQNQIFYPAVSGRDMWYDPVFRVETIDGRVVWCKRHYKVRNSPVGLRRDSWPCLAGPIATLTNSSLITKQLVATISLSPFHISSVVIKQFTFLIVSGMGSSSGSEKVIPKKQQSMNKMLK